MVARLKCGCDDEAMHSRLEDNAWKIAAQNGGDERAILAMMHLGLAVNRVLNDFIRKVAPVLRRVAERLRESGALDPPPERHQLPKLPPRPPLPPVAQLRSRPKREYPYRRM